MSPQHHCTGKGGQAHIARNGSTGFEPRSLLWISVLWLWLVFHCWYFLSSLLQMLIVAAVLLVLENESNYKCCQSENCSKKYMVRAIVLWGWLNGLWLSFLTEMWKYWHYCPPSMILPIQSPRVYSKKKKNYLPFCLLSFLHLCPANVLPEVQDLKIHEIRK